MHLAEILAATDASDELSRPTASGMTADVRRDAAVPERGPRGARRHPAAAQPGPRDPHDPRQARAGGRRGRRLGGAAHAGAALKDATLAEARRAPASSSRRRSTAAARSCTGRATPPRPARIVAEVAQAHGADEVVKVKSMATQEIGLNEALAAEGIAAWETDLAELIVQLGDDLPSHILVPAIHRNRAEIREIFRSRDGGGRPPGARRPDRRPGRAGRRPRGCTCARSSCAPRSASPARTSRSPRPGTLVVVESEGNGRMCLTLPEVLVSVVGIEKVVPTWRRPRRLPAAAAALLDRRADEPLHLDVVRRHPRRRPAGGARRPARQRPHPRPRRRGRPPGAALHPLLGLPQRLPGLRARRRPRLRLGLPRPDRRDPQPAAPRRRASTRRPTRCPTPRPCAAPATRSARSRSTSRRCWSTCAPRSSTPTAAGGRRRRRWR